MIAAGCHRPFRCGFSFSVVVISKTSLHKWLKSSLTLASRRNEQFAKDPVTLEWANGNATEFHLHDGRLLCESEAVGVVDASGRGGELGGKLGQHFVGDEAVDAVVEPSELVLVLRKLFGKIKLFHRDSHTLVSSLSFSTAQPAYNC